MRSFKATLAVVAMVAAGLATPSLAGAQELDGVIELCDANGECQRIAPAPAPNFALGAPGGFVCGAVELLSGDVLNERVLPIEVPVGDDAGIEVCQDMDWEGVHRDSLAVTAGDLDVRYREVHHRTTPFGPEASAVELHLGGNIVRLRYDS